MRLSILICTLEHRHEQFKFIYNKIIGQIKEALGLEKEIEIKFFQRQSNSQGRV
jgi:hypothetical protein